MSATTALLRFDRDHPVWTGELFVLAGESPEDLDLLARRGLVEEREGVWSLTQEGTTGFRAEAAECFLDAAPGPFPEDCRQSLRRTRWQLLLDRAFRGRWGLKEFQPGAVLPFWPGLSPEERHRCGTEGVRWLFEEHPAVRALRDRPLAIPSSREEAEAFRAPWDLPWGRLSLDLLLLFRYDFHCYQDQLPLPTDEGGFANTDRLLCRFVGADTTLEDLAAHLGEVHLFLLHQRRLLLPRLFDRDAQEQDAVTWWVGCCEEEGQARELAARWTPLGAQLAAPSLPLDLWLVSREVLEGVKEPEESFWDLFSRGGHRLFCPA